MGWLDKAKQLQRALQEFIDEIEMNYDEEEDEYSVNPDYEEDLNDRDFLSTLDALNGDLQYYID